MAGGFVGKASIKNINTCIFTQWVQICGAMSETNPTTYQYNQIEAALIAAFDLVPEDIPAFKGRLRHLRKNGVPNIPAVGRGGISEYTRHDLQEMVFALELEAIGVPPSKTPNIIANARKDLIVQLRLKDRSKGNDVWFVMVPNAIKGAWDKSFFASEDNLDSIMKKCRKESNRVTAANLTARLVMAEETIAKTSPAKRGP